METICTEKKLYFLTYILICLFSLTMLIEEKSEDVKFSQQNQLKNLQYLSIEDSTEATDTA